MTFPGLTDGVFTTARVADGALVWRAAHHARLLADAEALGPGLAGAVDAAMTAAEREARAHGAAMARIAVGTRTDGRAGWAVELAPPRRKPWEIGDEPLVFEVADDPRRPPWVKRFPRIELEALEKRALSRGASGVALVADGLLREGTWCHLLAFLGGGWATPALGPGVVRGTTRAVLLEALRAAGAPVEERPLPVADLARADAVFALSALLGAAPLAAFGPHALPNDAWRAPFAVLAVALARAGRDPSTP